MVVKDYFVPIRTNIPHAKPNYGPGKYKFEVYYCIHTSCSLENWLVWQGIFKNQVKK